MGKHLISAGHFVVALDYVLISLHFVARITPQSLSVWESEFCDFKCLQPLLETYYEDILAALFAVVCASLENHSQSAAVVSLLHDLAFWIQSSNEPKIIHHFVRLLTIGTPNVLSSLIRVLPTNSANSFVWLCIKISAPLRHRINRACVHVLVGSYIEIFESDANSQPNLCVLAELLNPYLESLNDVEENKLGHQDVVFIIRMFSEVACRSPSACRFRYALLQSFICPYLISVRMVSTPQIALALELVSSFIRLVGDLSELEAIQTASDALPHLNHVILNAPVSAASMMPVVNAFVDSLTLSTSVLWPPYLTFCDISGDPKTLLLKSLVLNFLQLVLRCVQAEPFATHSDLRISAWTALWRVLSHPQCRHWMSQPFLRTGTGGSLLLSLTKAAEGQLDDMVDASINLHVSLIGVLCGLYSGQKFILEPKVRTLSIPPSYYLNMEKKMYVHKDSPVQKHIDLLFFIFHRFLRICDLRKPAHPYTLKSFVQKVLKLRRHDLIGNVAVNNNQIRAWISNVITDVLELLHSQQPQNEDSNHSIPDLLVEFLEFFCIRNENESLSRLFQITSVQLSSLLQLAIKTNSRRLKLRIVRLLVGWSGHTDPLEPECFLAWPQYLNFSSPATLDQSQTVDPNDTSVFKNFAFVRSSISLDQWQFDPTCAYPLTLISTIWPLSNDQYPVDHDGRLVWLVPSTRGVYTRVKRRDLCMVNHSKRNSSEFILFGDAYLSDALTSNFWGHMLFSILWNKNSEANLTGIVSVTTNASTYTESTIKLSPLASSQIPGRNCAFNLAHRRQFTNSMCLLSLWMGHATAAFEVSKNAISKESYILTNGFHIFTGDILSQTPAKSTEGSRAKLRELALYFALCGPLWTVNLLSSSRDVWPTLSARGRCYLNSLLLRLPPRELGDLFMRGQCLLDAVTQFRGSTTPWIHTLKKLIRRNLLVSTGYPSLASVKWTIRIPPNHLIPSPSPDFTSLIHEKMRGPVLQVDSKLWAVDLTSNHDVEVTDQSINCLTKCSVDAAIASIGGIDLAFFLAGTAACASDTDAEMIAASLDFVLTLTRHSIVAAEKFYRPLSEELISQCSPDAFDRLHITNYGLCLLTSLINRVCLRRLSLALHEIFVKHAYVKVVDEKVHLLIDPELVICQIMFSSLESLPAILSAVGDCFVNANGSHNQILACNIASVDGSRLIEAAVTSFRICFPTSDGSEDVNRAFESTSESLSRLLSRRLVVSPPPSALLTFLLQTLASVDPDLYHCAAARAFASKARDTSLAVDLVDLTRSRLRFLRGVAISTFSAAPSIKRGEVPTFTYLVMLFITELIEGFDPLIAIIFQYEAVVPKAKVFQALTNESSEDCAEQHPSSPLSVTTSLPLIPLHPLLTLEGVSEAEAATLAKFRENILSGCDQSDSSLSSTLFGSCNSLLDFGNLDAVEEEIENGCGRSSLLTRYHSLPDISMSVSESSSFASQSVTEASTSLTNGETGPYEKQCYFTTTDLDAPVISPLQLSQRHHLAALMLSALTQFWQMTTARAVVGAELEKNLLIPPFWLIYHLGCHPCVKFREHALSLYMTLLSVQSDCKMCHSSISDRVLAMQFLSDTSSITLQYCSSVTEMRCAARCVLDPGGCSLVSLAHFALTSQSLLSSACKTLDSVVNTKPNQAAESVVVPASIALAVIASSLVDIESFRQICNEKPIEKALLVEQTNRCMECLDILSNFFNFVKADFDFLISLCNSFSLYILLEMVFFLQSTCSEAVSTNAYTERFHELGNLISRLLSSIISRAKDRVTFGQAKGIISHLRFGGNSIDRKDRPASNQMCIVREALLRVLLSLSGRILKDLNGDASDTESLLSQLCWTAVAVEDTLLYKGSATSLESLTADPPSLECPQFPIIHLLEKALITLFVNSASHAMRNTGDAIWPILSSSLMRLLHTWCEALLETFTISSTGLWLLTLLSQEPDIIQHGAVFYYSNILIELRNNLQMLEAVFSIKPKKPKPLECNRGTHEDTPLTYSAYGNDFVGDHDEAARRKIDYDKVSNAVKILLEWVEKLCSNFDHIPKKSSQLAIPTPTLPISELNLCPPLHVDQFDWLSPLRGANEESQHQWSMLVSQHRHILDVVAPFYWMQLSGAMGHECSVFCVGALKPAFSHVDTFEDESRRRCRRRPVVIWIDDRFVRSPSVNALGQYLKSHPLSPLMMHQSTYTPARGLARKRCLLTPHIQFPPSCQALFPPPVAFSDRCLGVWSCRLVGISDSIPLNGDLTLDANWIRLVINDKELLEFTMRNRHCTGALMHGLGGEDSQKEVLACPLRTITRVEERRFELRDLALELFFERACNMPPIMIAFCSNKNASQHGYLFCPKERDHFIRSLVEACGSLCTRPLDEWWRIPAGRRMTVLGQATSVRSSRGQRLSLRDLCDILVTPFSTPFVGPISRARLLDAQVAWLRGQISNFDYIMALNTAAGRTYNDITQYPIFPWIIADYESEVLDLEKPSISFRRLDRPISVQTESRIRDVSRHYEEMKAQQLELDVAVGEDQRTLFCPIFHYPSFCSNEAITLHLLFRLIPYAFRLIQFQDGNFDDPNRLFHSVASEWSLTTSSTAFAKELVPEFYFRPDMFINCENFELGARHDGEIVDSVKLPPWAKGDPRLFVLVNRAALESSYVTAHLPEWIDLVFGYKQTGRWGERAINLYHPFTYFGAIDVENIEDPLRRGAVESMIRNYGQVPRQLFPNHPHPRRTTSFITVKTSTDRHRYSDFFNLSRIIRYVLSRQQATMMLRRAEENEFQSFQSVVDSPIAMVKPLTTEEEEPWSNPGISAATSVPLTAGAPLDTVQGLRWGKWAGSPQLEPLGISWYANLQGGSRPYRLRSNSSEQPYAPWTILVTDSRASLVLLRLPSYPLLLVKITLLSNVITLTARRFVDGLELYSTTIPVPFVEQASIFIAAPSVDAKPLSHNAQIHLLVLYQHIPLSSEGLFSFDDLIDDYSKARGGRNDKKVRLSSSHVNVGWRYLIGHIGANVSCVDTCVQHGLIASGDTNGRVVVWDLASTAFIALLEMDEDSGVFGRVCGLAFDQTLGDLLVARTGPAGSHETWIGLFTADCRQSCSRILDFQAETGFTTNTDSYPYFNSHDNLPIVFSHHQGCQVGCILIGGPGGCLIWLSSWTLNTVSVMRLDQPSPCPVIALSFVPSSSVSTMRPADQTHTDSALYIIDSEGWIYFLESSPKAPPRQLRISAPGTRKYQDSNSLLLPGVWL
ncbi:unnamed protein product [Hydatigera taeniaeformis]|uniref:DUF4704 domain-containing protein n=1 Tax=Hydatigena taeniaeformis TaxID=6205 RepID=A0A0R3WIJ4_HYDTA|nr:unnamed protein product [Hydatigera taeniaeformis]